MEKFSIIQMICAGVIPIILAITLHEVAHGWVANQLGDPTAQSLGRLTVNPFNHISWVGTVLVPLVMGLLTPYLFGWAKPIPINERNLKYPIRDIAIVAAAGPVANFIMMICWGVLLMATHDMSWGNGSLITFMHLMFKIGISINILLLVVNLLPIPPLDGSRIIFLLLPNKWLKPYQQIEKWGLLILLILMLSGILGQVLYPIIASLHQLVYTFVQL